MFPGPKRRATPGSRGLPPPLTTAGARAIPTSPVACARRPPESSRRAAAFPLLHGHLRAHLLTQIFPAGSLPLFGCEADPRPRNRRHRGGPRHRGSDSFPAAWGRRFAESMFQILSSSRSWPLHASRAAHRIVPTAPRRKTLRPPGISPAQLAMAGTCPADARKPARILPVPTTSGPRAESSESL